MRPRFLQIYKVSLISFSITFLTYLCKNITNIILAQHLAPGLYGDFTLGIKTFIMAASLLLLGTGNTAKKFLSGYIYEKNINLIKNYVSWNFRLILFSNILFIALLTIFLVILFTLHLFNIKSLVSYHFAIYLLFIVPLGSLSLLLSSYLLSNKNIYWANIFSNNAQYFFYIILIIPAIYFFEIIVNQIGLFFLVFSVFMVLAIFEYFLVLFKLPSDIFGNTYKLIKKKETTSIWKTTSLKFIIHSLIFLLMATMDLYIVEVFSNKEHHVDQYSAILSIVSVMWLSTIAIYSVLAPNINGLLKAKKHNKLQNLINSTNVIHFVLLSIVLLIFLVFGERLLSLFGKSYGTSHVYTALVILSIGYYLGTFFRPAILLLVYSEHQSFQLWSSLLELMILIVLGIILTLKYDIIGTSIAASMAIILNGVISVIGVKLKLSFKPLTII